MDKEDIKKIKYLFIILVILAALILIVVSIIFVLKSNEKVSNGEDTLYIGINGHFVGTYSNGNWNNAQDLSDTNDSIIEKITTPLPYYIHMYGSEVKEIEDYIGTKGEDIESFKFSTVQEEFNTMEIITNNEEEIFTQQMEQVSDNTEFQDIINKVKKKKSVEDVETEITKNISVDYDKDGENENLIILNAIQSNDDYEIIDNGICNLVIAVDNNKYQVIYENLLGEDTEEYINKTIKDVVVCDINRDGILELCIQIDEDIWGTQKVEIYEIKNKFNLVMSGVFSL